MEKRGKYEPAFLAQCHENGGPAFHQKRDLVPFLCFPGLVPARGLGLLPQRHPLVLHSFLSLFRRGMVQVVRGGEKADATCCWKAAMLVHCAVLLRVGHNTLTFKVQPG